jgi:hypothetical protein
MISSTKGKAASAPPSDPIDKAFCIRFLTTDPIIFHEHTDARESKQIESEFQVKVNPSFVERNLIHNGDFADIYMAGDKKPIAVISAERVAFLINRANNTDKPCSEEEISQAIMSFRKVCGNDSQVEVLHLSPGESATQSRVGRTAYVYDPHAVQKVLTKQENEPIFKNAGFPKNINEFMNKISTVPVKKDEHPELLRIIEQELFSGHEHGRFTNDLYKSLGLPMIAPAPPLMDTGQAMYRTPDKRGWDTLESDASLIGYFVSQKSTLEPSSTNEKQANFKTIIYILTNDDLKKPENVHEDGIPKQTQVAFLSSQRGFPLISTEEIEIAQKEEGVVLNDFLVSPVPMEQRHRSGSQLQPLSTSSAAQAPSSPETIDPGSQSPPAPGSALRAGHGPRTQRLLNAIKAGTERPQKFAARLAQKLRERRDR